MQAGAILNKLFILHFLVKLRDSRKFNCVLTFGCNKKDPTISLLKPN